jgi:hypothetical protein
VERINAGQKTLRGTGDLNGWLANELKEAYKVSPMVHMRLGLQYMSMQCRDPL